MVALFIGLFNINKRKQRALFTKDTLTNRNKELPLENLHKETETKSFVYKIKVNKQKQKVLFTEPS